MVLSKLMMKPSMTMPLLKLPHIVLRGSFQEGCQPSGANNCAMLAQQGKYCLSGFRGV